MDAGFYVDALKAALRKYGKPKIFNTDQGRQFTSDDFTGVLKDTKVSISMDGRGRCMDNISIERLWRSLKYEAVYLHEWKAQRGIDNGFNFYNTERSNLTFGRRTPAEMYEGHPMDILDKPSG